MSSVPGNILQPLKKALKRINDFFRNAVNRIFEDVKDLLKLTPDVDSSIVMPHFEDFVTRIRRAGEAVKGRAYEVTSFFIPIISGRIDQIMERELKKRGIPPEAVGFIGQDPNLVSLLESITISAIEGMTDQGVRRLEHKIRAIILRGGTVAEIEDEIKESFKFLDFKANQIAVTESQRIWNKLYIERFKQFNIEAWTWRTTGDSFVCKYCKALDKQVFETGQKIKVVMGAKKKREIVVEHPPLHPGCRCKAVPKAKR